MRTYLLEQDFKFLKMKNNQIIRGVNDVFYYVVVASFLQEREMIKI